MGSLNFTVMFSRPRKKDAWVCDTCFDDFLASHGYVQLDRLDRKGGVVIIRVFPSDECTALDHVEVSGGIKEKDYLNLMSLLAQTGRISSEQASLCMLHLSRYWFAATSPSPLTYIV